MRDDVENLARAYLEIRHEGCIQFDDLVVRIHCNPQIGKPSVELKLQSIDESIIAKHTQYATSNRHCRDLYKFFNHCIDDWKKKMADERW